MPSSTRRGEVRPLSALAGLAFLLLGVWGLAGAGSDDVGWLFVAGVIVAGLIGLVAAVTRRG